MNEITEFLRACHDERLEAAECIHALSCSYIRIDAYCDCGEPEGACARVATEQQLLDLHPHTTQRQEQSEATLRNMYGPHWEKRLTHLDDLYCTTCHVHDGVIYLDDGKPCRTVRLLASLYATRPGFKEEWRP